jgi:hypothetical protein
MHDCAMQGAQISRALGPLVRRRRSRRASGEFVAAPFRAASDFDERTCHAKARRYETILTNSILYAEDEFASFRLFARKMPAGTPALLNPAVCWLISWLH